MNCSRVECRPGKKPPSRVPTGKIFAIKPLLSYFSLVSWAVMNTITFICSLDFKTIFTTPEPILGLNSQRKLLLLLFLTLAD